MGEIKIQIISHVQPKATNEILRRTLLNKLKNTSAKKAHGQLVFPPEAERFCGFTYPDV